MFLHQYVTQFFNQNVNSLNSLFASVTVPDGPPWFPDKAVNNMDVYLLRASFAEMSATELCVPTIYHLYI